MGEVYKKYQIKSSTLTLFMILVGLPIQIVTKLEILILILNSLINIIYVVVKNTAFSLVNHR